MEPTQDRKASTADGKEPKKWKVTLAGQHEHRGQLYGVDDVITVHEGQIKRLQDKKLIKAKVPA